MAKFTPMIIVVLVPFLLWFGVTLLQGIVWTVTALTTVLIIRRFWQQLAPTAPVLTSTAPTDIEDAVVVYTLHEAIALNQGYLMVWGVLLIASLVVI